MKHFANGDKLTLTAKVAVTQGKPFLHGKILMVPCATVPVGKAFTAEYKGAFSLEAEDVKEGITPTFEGEPAYWAEADKALTTTASGNTKVGYFVNHLGDDVLLLTGA